MSGVVQVGGELIATRRVGAYHHLTLVAPGVAELAHPGQFVALAVGGPTSANLLRRCFSIHRVKPSGTYGGTVDVVVAAHGPGTVWLTGLRATDVFALMSAPLDAPVELHDALTVRYEGGAIGTVSGGSAHLGAGNNKHQLEVRAIGSAGQMLIDVEREAAWLWRDAGETDLHLDLEPDAGAYDCDGPPNTLVDLALGRDVVNQSPGELGARTTELLDAAYRSARSGVLEPVARS